MELIPQLIQLALLLFIKHQSRERRVIAEITGHQMKPRAQQSPSARFVLLQKNEAAFPNIESVRNDRAKTPLARLVAGAPVLLGGHHQGTLRHVAQWRIAWSVRKTLERQSIAAAKQTVRRVLPILPKHKRLGTRSNPAHGEVGELRSES